VIRTLVFALATLAVVSAARGAESDQALIEAQAMRVERAVSSLQPHEPGVTDVFFVGFAGYGAQDVFRLEAAFARDVFARRYGTGSRSLLLVNDEEDRASFPLATRTNLRHALQLIAGRMDPREDILVLLLTSHGSALEGLEVSNGALPLARLSPADVRSALADAGIRWRVVIASACFAGVFIPPLRDEATLIVTAADARHSSFGCEDDRELTWFGEAFFRDSLPGAASIQEAFVKARGIIERRERAARVERSRPQMHVGRHIRRKLLEIDSPADVAPTVSATPVD
jgi:hypothetical protein